MDNDFHVISENNGINVKQYKCYNSNVLVLTKNNLKVKFNYYKLNGIVFININGDHLFDFKTLLLIDMLENIKEEDKTNLSIKHSRLGEIKIKNCNVEIFEKGLCIINEWIEKNKNFFKDLYGYF